MLHSATLNGLYRNNNLLSFFLVSHFLAVLASPAGRAPDPAYQVYAPPSLPVYSSSSSPSPPEPPYGSTPSFALPSSSAPAAYIYPSLSSSSFLYNNDNAAVGGLDLLELDHNATVAPISAVAKVAADTGPSSAVVPVMLPANGAPSAPFVTDGSPTTTGTVTMRTEQRIASSSTTANSIKEAWGATVTDGGGNSYIRQMPTVTFGNGGSGGGGQKCPVSGCKDYMNMSCFVRYGGCWDMCAENRKYLAPDCLAQTMPPVAIGAEPTAAPTTPAVVTTA